MPSQRPQKGRQAVMTTGGETWAGTDEAFNAAVAFSPGVFLWARAQARLVVLSALWTSVPLQNRDPRELAGAVKARLLAFGLERAELPKYFL